MAALKTEIKLAFGPEKKQIILKTYNKKEKKLLTHVKIEAIDSSMFVFCPPQDGTWSYFASSRHLKTLQRRYAPSVKRDFYEANSGEVPYTNRT